MDRRIEGRVADRGPVGLGRDKRRLGTSAMCATRRSADNLKDSVLLD